MMRDLSGSGASGWSEVGAAVRSATVDFWMSVTGLPSRRGAAAPMSVAAGSRPRRGGAGSRRRARLALHGVARLLEHGADLLVGRLHRLLGRHVACEPLGDVCAERGDDVQWHLGPRPALSERGRDDLLERRVPGVLVLGLGGLKLR